MGRAVLSMTTLAALLTAATCDYCNSDIIGSTEGLETIRTAIVAPNLEKYDIQVQPVCPEDNIVGLLASGCSEYNWTLSLTNKTTVHVYRVEGPEELYVKLSVYCNFSKSYYVEAAEWINSNPKDNIDFK